MCWSLSLILMAGLSAPDATQASHVNYGKAWSEAASEHRPMLVILNPANDSEASQNRVTWETLEQDERTKKELDNYVVAIIDTGSDHGKAVHSLFGNPQLPRIVVIDERQEKQVFRSSEQLDAASLARILEAHRTNAVTTTTRFHPATSGSFNSLQQRGTCPNCRRY